MTSTCFDHWLLAEQRHRQVLHASLSSCGTTMTFSIQKTGVAIGELCQGELLLLGVLRQLKDHVLSHVRGPDLCPKLKESS